MKSLKLFSFCLLWCSLPLLLSSCTIGPCGVNWIWGSANHSQTVIAPKSTKNLGAFEIVAGMQTNFSLSTVRSCTLVGKQAANNDMQLQLDFYSTNANGTVDHIFERDDTVQGQQRAYRVWDMMVLMKPTVKLQ
jgi:hypothetical protein